MWNCHYRFYFHSRLYLFFILFFSLCGVLAQVNNIPAASSYVPTQIQGVYGGLSYGLSIQQNTSVYADNVLVILKAAN